MMGYGDDIMATGLARGAHQAGSKVAFGDGKRIIWGPYSEEIFKNNPNIARPEATRDKTLKWIPYYKGNRIYNKLENGRWIWNYDFKAMPGEIFLQDHERCISRPEHFIVMEPHVPKHKSSSSNKDWGFDRYQKVCDKLLERYTIVQFANGKKALSGAISIPTKSFRHAMAIMSHAKLAIVPEGGLHHAAAALGIPTVVIFGGFIPPAVTGYEGHVNLTGGEDVVACGSLNPCKHCRSAMNAISVDQVTYEAERLLHE